MFKTILPFLIPVLLLWGCSSAPETNQLIIEETIGNEDYRQLEELELMILEYKKTENPASLQTAENQLAGMIADPSLNKEFEARVHALHGEVLYYLGDIRAARTIAEQAELLFKTEPQLHLLKALLEKNPEKKILILEEARARDIISGRLLVELAELYFQAEEFGIATGLYDEAFTLLPEPYVAYYRKNRELARQFIENPPDDMEARDYIGIEKLLVSDMLNILLLQSTYLDSIAPRKDIERNELTNLLKKEGYIHPDDLRQDDLLVRKDTAYLILSIISRLEGNPELMHSYADQFLDAEMESPVPDVKVSDYFFDAVLNLVEREIMELPDGINFEPDKTVSGLELNDILKALKQYYGY